MPGIGDIFRELLPFKFGNVSFPVSEMTIDLVQDIAEHKYWGADGAKLEATGRAPLHITAKIPFDNGIFPGKGERWNPSILYPDCYRAFLSEMADRRTKELQHPELGTIRCKPVRCSTVWSGARQGGVVVDASWKETTDDEEFNPIAGGELVSGIIAAGDLDAALSPERIRALKALVPKLPPFRPNFGDTLRPLVALTDTISLLSRRNVGQIERLGYQVDRLVEAFEQARSALTWEVERSCVRLGDTLTRIREEIAASGRALAIYVVPIETTLTAVARTVRSDIDTLLRLNPHLARSCFVPSRQVVKYWRDRNV